MRLLSSPKILTTSLLFLFHQAPSVALNSLTIPTTSGHVTGFINGSHPHVAQFLSIPFAEPPINSLRFAPPVRLSSKGKSIDATKFGVDCPQYRSNWQSIYSIDTDEYNVVGPSGEDCLTLSIWAPWNGDRDSDEDHEYSEEEGENCARELKKRRRKRGSITKGRKPVKSKYLKKKKLPVVIWIFGGDFQFGGAQVPYQQPAPWVERSGEHIFVQVNYRLNIFGFPGAAGQDISKGANLGFLDQRLAVEWVRDNIEEFGGDSERITLFGQSAGAGSADFYNYAYPKDPIISGLILSSGSSIATPGLPIDSTHTSFSVVASNFGCDKTSPKGELDCLRKIPSADIIKFLQEYQESGEQPSISFYPVVDNVTIFADNAARARNGEFTKVPAIHGTLNNEDATLTRWTNDGTTVNVTAANFGTVRRACTAVQTTNNRFAGNATTFRYYYTGNFTNISPRPWQGAYHASELPVIFGTHDIARGPSTKFEYAVSHRIQDLWLAFIKDPIKGLPKKGWPAWIPERGQALEFAWDGRITQLIPTEAFEKNCIEGTITPVAGAVPPDSNNFGIV